ncbi:MAG: BamA/TamA family outer membrane protein, partial [Bacteroidota bacterium]
FKSTIDIDTITYDSLGIVKGLGHKVRNWISRWSGAKRRYINIKYKIDLNNRSYIDSIQHNIEDTVLQTLIFENIKKSPLKKGYYDQETLSEERDFIYDLAVNNGYYEFSKQYITFKIDSIQLGKDSVIIREIVKNPPGKTEHKIFYLDSIVFVTDANVSRAFNRTQEKYRDITFEFGKNRYSKKVLEWRIPLEQDDPYSRDLTIETQRQLSFLDNFKFININYDTTGNYFVANIFTSPFDKYQTSSEFGLSRTQGRPGPFVSVNLKNRNTFRTLEILSFDASARLEDLPSIEESDVNRNYTSRQFGAEGAITFPQFLFPLSSYYKNKMGRFNPKTRVSLGFSFEDRVSEYRRVIYTGRWSYSWQLRDRIKYTLTPFQLSLTDATVIPGSFFDRLRELRLQNNPYALAFESGVVTSTGGQMDINIGNYANGQDGGFARLSAEFGGNLNDILGNSFFGDSLQTYKYAKAQIDLRRIDRLARKTNLAYRLNIGLAYPYGSNQALPYEKYFFAGGSSSIRAWRPRRLGPGSFGRFTDEEGNSLDVVNNDIEQPGELLIESSIELRQDLVGFLEGAIFVDAGNIWLVRNAISGVDEDGDDGIFRFNEFTNDIAVGTGVGLRFDLQFLIFRVDLGMRLIDPVQKRGERFVGDKILSEFDRNTEINIGIGYPF